jgi:hypothetical protein
MTGARAAGSAPRAALRIALLLAVPAAAVGALYLMTYAVHHYAFPVGYDTPKYLWRTDLVAANGVHALVGSAPLPFHVNADRPGFPVLVSTLAAVLGSSSARVAMVLPACMAALIGLGAGAFSLSALDQPRWAVPVFVLATGASVNVSRMAGPGYDDNLILAAIVVAAGAMALAGADGRPALAGAVLLLSAGALVHWIFAVLFAGVLAVVAAALLPESRREWRTGRSAWETPSGRLAEVLGASALIGGMGLLSLGAGEPSPPKLPGESFRVKFRRDVPRYAFPPAIAVAAIGAAALARTVPAARRRGLALLTVWALSGAGGALLLAIGLGVPAHRLVAFGLGLPMLVAAGLVAVAGLCAGRGSRVGRTVGALVVAAGLAGGSVLAYRAWDGAHPWMYPKQVGQAELAGEYLQRAGGDAPIVLIMDIGGKTPLSSTALAFHVARAALPAEVVPRTLLYVGEAESFLAGRPTRRPSPPTFDQASLRSWPSVRDALAKTPIAVMMPAYSRGFAAAIAAHPEWLVAPSLAVVQGRRDVGALPTPPPIEPPGARLLALISVACVLLLALAGSGWAMALVPDGPDVAAALAPAFGVATLVLGGVLAGRLGLRPSGAGAVALMATVTILGWAAAAAGRRRRRRAQAERISPALSRAP